MENNFEKAKQSLVRDTDFTVSDGIFEQGTTAYGEVYTVAFFVEESIGLYKSRNMDEAVEFEAESAEDAFATAEKIANGSIDYSVIKVRGVVSGSIAKNY